MKFDANKMLGMLGMIFPDLNSHIDKAKSLTNGVEDSFDGVKNFMRSNNITNKQIDDVANFIQNHPKAKMFMGVPFLVANQIRQLKGDDMNTNKAIAPKMQLPVQKSFRTTKL